MIVTERLQLIPATVDPIRAALESPAALSRALGVSVPPTWPPEYLDDAALRYTVDKLSAAPNQAAWWMYFVVLRERSGGTLIGSAGYVGPPSPDGTVELGYGIVADRRRKGYATEVVRGMVAHAFAVPEVRRVIAETLPSLEPSIGVLRKCSFQLIDERSAPEVIRFELTRAAYEAAAGAR